MRRFFNILLGALAMIAAALLSAFVTMRLAIHGREVEIPSVAGMTVAEARSLAASRGLNMNLENHFYSTAVPAGRILSQYPEPGTKVRREWVLRVAESIGPQRVSVPDVIGQTEREASVTIRRLALDLGTVAYIPAPGPAGIVLSQTPTPAAEGVDGPRISLLVSEPVPAARVRPLDTGVAPEASATDDAAQAADGAAGGTAMQAGSAGDDASGAGLGGGATDPASPIEAYVMPNLIGMTLSNASARVAAMGLHIASVEVMAGETRPIAAVPSVSPPGSSSNGQPAPVKPIAPIAPITLANTVIAQTPAAGHRVTKGDAIRVTLTR